MPPADWQNSLQLVQYLAPGLLESVHRAEVLIMGHLPAKEKLIVSTGDDKLITF